MAEAVVPSELVVAESHAIEPSAQRASASLDTYLKIQRVFDEKMPDAIMTIKGKKFRKKSYWRAIATAFNVESRLISEERVEIDGDWGYLATYRATTNDGRQCDGDGACMASEKVDKYGNPTGMQTVHNVRAHAHTRAKNRAIADLVGFGEVSADELGPDAYADRDERPRPGPAKPVKRGGSFASENQLKLLAAKGFERAKVIAADADQGQMCGSIVKAAMRVLSFERKEDITKDAIDPLIEAIKVAVLDPEDESHAMIPEEGGF
jgi:hypothetical protein